MLLCSATEAGRYSNKGHEERIAVGNAAINEVHRQVDVPDAVRERRAAVISPSLQRRVDLGAALGRDEA